MVQNADDAGAKEVKFIFDNKQWDSQTLLRPELQNFQVCCEAPAAYVLVFK